MFAPWLMCRSRAGRVVGRSIPASIRALVSLRALCLQGRAHAGDGAAGEVSRDRRGEVWLCTDAPLWVVCRVVELLQWP